MHKLEALRIFCAAAETQNFRQAALALGVSPQVVTRAVAYLEALFGEPLFIRNTRSTRITPLGEQVYEQARAALQHTDALFQHFSLHERTTLQGRVRVDTPQLDEWDLLPRVLHLLADAPGIVLDWRSSDTRSQTDRDQIDVGVRVGPLPSNDFIVKPITPLRLQTVMALALLARLGKPRSVADLRQRYPLAALVDNNTGRAFTWDYPGHSFAPETPAFISPDLQAQLQAVLHGVAVGQFAQWSVRQHIRAGRLHAVLPRQEMTLDWQLFVYRPQRHQHTARVKRVFDALVAALEAAFAHQP